MQRLRLKNSAILDDLNIWNEWEKSLVHYKQDKEKNSFTEAGAFEIFYDFLGAYYDRTQSDDIGSFLGDILHGQYGEVVDPAAWYDWQKSIIKDVDAKGLLLKEGLTPIRTTIDGLKVEIHVYLENGVAKSIDGYIGHSPRKWHYVSILTLKEFLHEQFRQKNN